MRSLPSDQTAVDTTAYEGDIQLVFSQVYLLMALGLVITAVVAAGVSTSPTMLRLIYTNWWVPLGLFVVQIILVIALDGGHLAPVNGCGCGIVRRLCGAAGRLTVSHFHGLHGRFDRHNVPRHRRHVWRDEHLWLCDQTRPDEDGQPA